VPGSSRRRLPSTRRSRSGRRPSPGLEGSVTAGVVSATDRSVVASDNQVRSVIQTDASINPGNSGGPLADAQGRVIGINDSIFSQSGGNEGLGFALPITFAKHIADLLVAGEPIQIAFLGVSGTEPTSGEAGALVTEVVSGSPAEQAGIEVGDLITSFGDTRVESLVDLAAQVRTSRPGDQVTIHVVRGNDELDLSATLATSS
jgi:putative serine protease PepD